MRRRTARWDWNGSQSSRVPQRLLWDQLVAAPERPAQYSPTKEKLERTHLHSAGRHSSRAHSRGQGGLGAAEHSLNLQPVLDELDRRGHATRPAPAAPFSTSRTTHSTLMKVTWTVTSKPTARFIVGLVSLAVIPAVTLAVRFQRPSWDFASRFRPAPAASAAVLDTSPRPLIPPSQRRREGSAGGDGKKQTSKTAGVGLHLTTQFQWWCKHNDNCDTCEHQQFP